MFGAKCKCGANSFHRGHEHCPELKNPVQLTGRQRIRKTIVLKKTHKIRRQQNLTLTDIDWLLNTGQYEAAYHQLKRLESELMVGINMDPEKEGE